MWRAFVPVALVILFASGCAQKPGPTAASTPEKPVEAAEKPAEAAEKPVEAAEKPAEAAEKPAEAAEKPVEAAEKPVEAAEKPVEAAEKPAEAATPTEENVEKNPNVVVAIETSHGTMEVELYADKTPITVKNFLHYVENDFYNGTLFHRVVPGFVIQGGGFAIEMQQKPTGAPIPNEAQKGVTNDRGTIAMARTQIRDSATSQFFINLTDNAMLNYRNETPQGWGYCAFGRVIKGLDIADKIAALPKENLGGPFTDITVDRVMIRKVSIINRP
jgi:cyclophilin family peptidyl-prolyl cis-trans isomerase